MEDSSGPFVEKEFGCPFCGERDTDQLIFLDDGDKYVRCSTCGTLYEVGVPTPPLNTAAMQRLFVAGKFALEIFTKWLEKEGCAEPAEALRKMLRGEMV